jgi:hypothetical protein
MLKLSDLKTLPLNTLYLMAMACARDIDAGEDKHALLKSIFDVIAERTP